MVSTPFSWQTFIRMLFHLLIHISHFFQSNMIAAEFLVWGCMLLLHSSTTEYVWWKIGSSQGSTFGVSYPRLMEYANWNHAFPVRSTYLSCENIQLLRFLFSPHPWCSATCSMNVNLLHPHPSPQLRGTPARVTLTVYPPPYRLCGVDHICKWNTDHLLRQPTNPISWLAWNEHVEVWKMWLNRSCTHRKSLPTTRTFSVA